MIYSFFRFEYNQSWKTFYNKFYFVKFFRFAVTMKKQFDLTILGNDLQSIVLAYEATKAGLHVAHLHQERTGKIVGNESFIVFRLKHLTKSFALLKQDKLIKHLKKIASHLLLSTEIEEYKKLSFFSVIVILLQNLFLNKQIILSKVNRQRKFYKLSYQSYKISVNRLISVILKSSEKSNYKSFSYTNTFTIEFTKNKYKINSDKGGLTFESNRALTLISDKNASSPDEEGVFITYPNDLLKLEKTYVWEDKNVSIKIIPWFEWVYFEVNAASIEKKSPEELIDLLHRHFPSIHLEKNKIPKIGINKRIRTYSKYNYHADNKMIIIKFSSVNDFFSKSNKLINKITLNRKNTTEDTVLIGSDFKMPYHPLRIMEYCDEKYDEAKHILRSPQYFKKLFYRYGTEIDKITYQAYEFWNKTKNIKQSWLKAEIWYVINYEHCTSAEAFISKHTEEWMAGDNINEEFIKYAFEELLKKS